MGKRQREKRNTFDGASPVDNEAGLEGGTEIAVIVDAPKRAKKEENDVLPEMDLLQRLVAPVTKEDFLAQIFKKKALVVKPNRDGLKRVEKLVEEHFFGLDVMDMLQNTASEKIFAWLPGMKRNDGEKKIGSVELSNAQDAWTAFQAGASLYFRSSQDAADTWIRMLSESLGLGFGARYNDGSERGEIECFVTHPGNVTEFHFDFMENFTIQLAGKKKWSLHRGKHPIKHPLRGSTPHYNIRDDTLEQQQKLHRMQQPSFSESDAIPGEGVPVETVELTPGTIFYFPAGMWHKVEAIGDEPSISINFSLMNISWADLIADSLRQMMWADDRFRAGIMLEDSHFQDMKSLKGGKKAKSEGVARNIARGEQARQHLGGLLSELGSWLKDGKIDSSQILTPSLLQPRYPEEQANETEQRYSKKEDSCSEEEIKGTSLLTFLRSPIASIADSKEEEGFTSMEEDESEDDENVEEEESERYIFAVHTHFGNDGIVSGMKTTFNVPAVFRAGVEWMIGATHKLSRCFDLEELVAHSAKGMDSNEATWLLGQLVECGYLTSKAK